MTTIRYASYDGDAFRPLAAKRGRGICGIHLGRRALAGGVLHGVRHRER